MFEFFAEPGGRFEAVEEDVLKQASSANSSPNASATLTSPPTRHPPTGTHGLQPPSPTLSSQAVRDKDGSVNEVSARVAEPGGERLGSAKAAGRPRSRAWHRDPLGGYRLVSMRKESQDSGTSLLCTGQDSIRFIRVPSPSHAAKIGSSSSPQPRPGSPCRTLPRQQPRPGARSLQPMHRSTQLVGNTGGANLRALLERWTGTTWQRLHSPVRKVDMRLFSLTALVRA